MAPDRRALVRHVVPLLGIVSYTCSVISINVGLIHSPSCWNKCYLVGEFCVTSINVLLSCWCNKCDLVGEICVTSINVLLSCWLE